MKRRYRHVMATCRGDGLPTVLMGLAVDVHMEPVKGHRKLERMVLDRWYASYTVRDAKCGVSTRDAESGSVSEWWRFLKAASAVRGQTLVASLGAMANLALLDFWEGLEDGRVRIVHDSDSGKGQSVEGDSRLQSDRSHPGVAGWGIAGNSNGGIANGVLIAEDPPTILYFYFPGSKTIVRWIDARNLGIQRDEGSGQGMTLARNTAGILTRIAGCLKERGLGGLKDTAAAQSLHSFKRKHLKTAIWCHTVKGVLDMEQDAYYGGRCECGRIGTVEGPIYELDIRGSYNYTMLHTPVPVRLVGFELFTAVGEVPEPGIEAGLIATVSVKTEQPDYPYRREGITVWPVGILRTTLCGPELYDAWDRGRIVKWHQWAMYDMEPALAGYAKEFYDIRCQAEKDQDKELAGWAKACIVSLVGKLGQKAKRWQWIEYQTWLDYYDQQYKEWTDGRIHRFQSIAGHHRMEWQEEWGEDSVPAIAAWVTSAARVRLLAAMRCARRVNCLYYDTDSLFVTEDGLHKLRDGGWINSGELGFFTLKGVHEWVKFRGLKSYQTPEVDRSAGIPGSGRSPVLAAEGYRQSLWLSTYLEQGSPPQSLQKKERREGIRPYRHGLLMSGGSVHPLIVSDPTA